MTWFGLGREVDERIARYIDLKVAGGGGDVAHNLLSATHGDTLASTVTRGSLVYGNATPAWAQLNIGTAGQVLTVAAGGLDVEWAAAAGGVEDNDLETDGVLGILDNEIIIGTGAGTASYVDELTLTSAVVTGSDYVIGWTAAGLLRRFTVSEFPAGSETNSLEVVCTGILANEVPVGSGADVATYTGTTGTGNVVRATSATLTTPTLTTPTIAATGWASANHNHGAVNAGGDLANNSITNAILSDMTAWTIKMESSGISADPSDTKISALVEEVSPAALDWVIIELATGELRKADIGNLPAGSEVNALETVCTGILTDEVPVGSGADVATYTATTGSGSVVRATSPTITTPTLTNPIIVTTGTIDDAGGDPYLEFVEAVTPTNHFRITQSTAAGNPALLTAIGSANAGMILAGSGIGTVQLIAPEVAATDWTNANHSHAAGNSGGQIAISDTTGTLAATRGGTDQSVYVVGDLLYADSTTTLTTRTIASGSPGDVLTITGGLPTWSAPGGGTTHELLSATHTDTTTATVVRGDLVVGQQASPKWERLAIGGAATYLRSDATDATWTALDVTDDAAISGFTGSGTTVVRDASPTIATPTLTNPVIVTTGTITDAGGDPYLTFVEHATPANDFMITQGTTAAPCVLTAIGEVNAGMQITGSGTGTVEIIAPKIAATDWTNANHSHAAGNSGGQIAISDTTGTLAGTRGGTDLSSFSANSILYASGVNTWAERVAGSNDDVLTIVAGVPTWQAPAGGSTHELLSATHTDTTTATVVRGDLVVGQQVSPKWERLAIGTAGQVLTNTGTDTLWGSTVRITQLLDTNGTNLIDLTTTTSAVNGLDIINEITGQRPRIGTTGEADIGIDFQNDQDENILRLTPVATGVTYYEIQNNITNNNPVLTVAGETNVGMDIQSAGTGNIRLIDGRGSDRLIASYVSVATAGTYMQIQQGVVDGDTLIRSQTQGASTAAGINLVPTGAGIVKINSVEAVDISSGQTLTNKVIDGSQLVDGSVALAKHADFKEYSILGKDTAGTGAPLNLDETDIPTEAAPTTGDWLLGWDAAGLLVKYDIGNLPAGGEINDLSVITTGIADNQLALGTGVNTAIYTTVPTSQALQFNGTAFVQAALADLSDVTGTTGTGSTVVFSTSPTLTTPIIVTTGSINDAGGDPYVEFVEATTPVNYFRITQSTAAGNPALLTAVGSANAGMILAGSGTGTVQLIAPEVASTDWTNANHSHAAGNSGGAIAISATTGTLAEGRGGTNQTTYATGDILYASASNTLSKLAVGTNEDVLRVQGGIPNWVSPTRVKSLTLENPTATEDVTLWYTDVAVTILNTRTVLNNGTATPTVTWEIRYDADRSAVGTVLQTAVATTSTTTGDSDSTFTNPNIPAGRWVWLTTTAQGGTVPEFHISIQYDEQ